MSLLARFSLLGLAITFLIVLFLGWILQRQIEQIALRQEAESAADQVSLVLRTRLLPSDFTPPLDPERLGELDRLFQELLFQRHIVRVKLWNPEGVLVYSDEKELIGHQFPMTHELQEALNGKLAMEISSLGEVENVAERSRYTRLMEIYTPVYLPGISGVVGAYEVYHDLAVVQPAITRIRRSIWAGIVLGFLLLFVSLFGVVREASSELARRAEENARLATEREQVNQELRHALRVQEEMIQNVSHELRTPLTLIQGFAEILRDGLEGELNSNQAEAVRMILSNSARLGRMINLLIGVQETAYSKGQPASEPLDLVNLLNEIVATWEPRLRQLGHPFRREVLAQSLPVAAEPGDLWRVFDHLLDNACKFNQPGGSITLRVWQENHTVHVAVSDQGIGIPADQLERIFERFYQVSQGTTRRYGGLGLGLTLCRQIVEGYGGRIWAESPGPGHGSTFIFTLPLAE
jgi:signal transduction histidine kinase